MISKIRLCLILLVSSAIFSGCVSNMDRCCKTPDFAIPGTDTVFVGVSVNKERKVKTTTKQEILHPGQKAIFSSAHEFKIIFENGKSPVGKPELESENGIIIVKIPKGIFEDDKFSDEFKRNGELVFYYEIKVGELSLDPPMRIIPN